MNDQEVIQFYSAKLLATGWKHPKLLLSIEPKYSPEKPYNAFMIDSGEHENTSYESAKTFDEALEKCRAKIPTKLDIARQLRAEAEALLAKADAIDSSEITLPHPFDLSTVAVPQTLPKPSTPDIPF